MGLLSSLEICQSKKAFWSYEAAKRAAKRRNQRYAKHTRSYKCDHCQLWHHTTKPKLEVQ